MKGRILPERLLKGRGALCAHHPSFSKEVGLAIPNEEKGRRKTSLRKK